ncbi:MAG: hypothetical protein WC100_13570, partial [Sterolibacterium sp.]
DIFIATPLPIDTPKTDTEQPSLQTSTCASLTAFLRLITTDSPHYLTPITNEYKAKYRSFH